MNNQHLTEDQLALERAYFDVRGRHRVSPLEDLEHFLLSTQSSDDLFMAKPSPYEERCAFNRVAHRLVTHTIGDTPRILVLELAGIYHQLKWWHKLGEILKFLPDWEKPPIGGEEGQNKYYELLHCWYSPTVVDGERKFIVYNDDDKRIGICDSLGGDITLDVEEKIEKKEPFDFENYCSRYIPCSDEHIESEILRIEKELQNPPLFPKDVKVNISEETIEDDRLSIIYEDDEVDVIVQNDSECNDSPCVRFESSACYDCDEQEIFNDLPPLNRCEVKKSWHVMFRGFSSLLDFLDYRMKRTLSLLIACILGTISIINSFSFKNFTRSERDALIISPSKKVCYGFILRTQYEKKNVTIAGLRVLCYDPP